MKPASGEKSSDLPTPSAWLQSTPPVPLSPAATIWFMTPTPMIEPMSACKLEFGMPKYQAQRFQMMAAMRSAIVGSPVVKRIAATPENFLPCLRATLRSVRLCSGGEGGTSPRAVPDATVRAQERCTDMVQTARSHDGFGKFEIAI